MEIFPEYSEKLFKHKLVLLLEGLELKKEYKLAFDYGDKVEEEMIIKNLCKLNQEGYKQAIEEASKEVITDEKSKKEFKQRLEQSLSDISDKNPILVLTMHNLLMPDKDSKNRKKSFILPRCTYYGDNKDAWLCQFRSIETYLLFFN